MGEDKGFKNFKDLLRSKGGEVKPEPEENSRGWTVEDSDGELSDFEGDESESMRERIARRPAAFGAMDTGPECYHDASSDEMELLATFRVRTVFPEDVLEEVESIPDEPDESEFEGRMDLRDEEIYTIDGADAKDFDDAIGIKDLGDGKVEIGVHIADVAHYVTPETKLDAEALARSTSCYLPDQVVPMLPEKLSNGLCSLVPERARLAYSVFMTFDEKGDRVDSRVGKSVIRSVKRNTYKEVQELLDGEDTPAAREIKHLEGTLRLFETWARAQQRKRETKGAMRIQSTEMKFVFDEKGEVQGLVEAPRYFSMSLIEETALAANQAVGDLFRKRGLPTIYRVHPEKDPDEIEAVIKMLEEHKIRVPHKDRLFGRDIARMIQGARRKANAEALIQRIMGLVDRAVYEVHDHKDVAKHFGLAKEAYLHFTSPIRRYPDLIVHRWMHAIESRGAEAEEEIVAEDFLRDLNDVAQHASIQSEVAEMASRAVGDLKTCQFVDPHVGEKLDATVIRVNRAGMEVRLDSLNVRGFLPARSIGDRVEVKGSTINIRAGRQHKSFSEGHPIAVRIKDVDFMKLSIFLELA